MLRTGTRTADARSAAITPTQTRTRCLSGRQCRFVAEAVMWDAAALASARVEQQPHAAGSALRSAEVSLRCAANDFVVGAELFLCLGGKFAAAGPELDSFLVSVPMPVDAHDFFSTVIPRL